MIYDIDKNITKERKKNKSYETKRIIRKELREKT